MKTDIDTDIDFETGGVKPFVLTPAQQKERDDKHKARCKAVVKAEVTKRMPAECRDAALRAARISLETEEREFPEERHTFPPLKTPIGFDVLGRGEHEGVAFEVRSKCYLVNFEFCRDVMNSETIIRRCVWRRARPKDIPCQFVHEFEARVET